MQIITAHKGRLLKTAVGADLTPGGAEGETSVSSHTLRRSRTFVTGLEALDSLLPGGAFPCGVVHELLTEPRHGRALSFALLLAKSAMGEGAIVWCDPRREIYPPALDAAGVPLDRVLFLHPSSPADQLWAMAECLRCRGVTATVAAVDRLSRIEARRLQLAAERGGGVGLLLRPTGPQSAIYAAATRWRVAPAPGDRAIQRWNIELIHGHGGQVASSVILEVCRETNHVRAVAAMADRPDQARATG